MARSRSVVLSALIAASLALVPGASGAHHGHISIARMLSGAVPSQAQAIGSAGSGGSSGSSSADYAPRATSDRADVRKGKQTHLIYFVPRDRPDQRLDTKGTIGRSFDSIRAWFRAQSGRQPRADLVRAKSYGRTRNVHDVTFVRGSEDAAAYVSLGDLSQELKQKGFSKSSKRYLVYAALTFTLVSEGDVCGEGFWPVDEPGGAQGSNYAALYLDADPGCGSRDFGTGTASGAGRAEVVALQEWIHTEGLVNPGAQRALTCTIDFPLPAHVCTGALGLFGLDPEQVDVMFPFATNLRLSQKVLDRHRDDYFDHDREATLGPGCEVLHDVDEVDDGACYDLKDSAWLERA